MQTNTPIKTGREYDNPLWIRLTLEEKQEYNRLMQQTAHTLNELMHEAKVPYAVTLFLREAEDEHEFVIDYDESVMFITTDQGTQQDNFKANAGVLAVGIERGLVTVIDSLISYLRKNNRYYYLSTLRQIKAEIKRMALEVAGVVVGEKKDISTFVFAYRPDDWVLTVQRAPFSTDTYHTLPELWHQEMAVAYAAHFKLEPESFNIESYLPALKYRKGLNTFLQSKVFPNGISNDPVETVEVSRPPMPINNKTHRADGEYVIGSLKSYQEFTLHVLEHVLAFARDLGVEEKIDLLLSANDDTGQYEPEKTLAMHITKVEKREDKPLDEGDTIALRAEGTLVTGAEHGLLWLIDDLLDHSNLGMFRAIPLLGVRGELRAGVELFTSIKLPIYAGVAFTPTQDKVFKFVFEDSYDGWNLVLSRLVDEHTPPSVLTERDKHSLVVHLARFFGADLNQKPLVTFENGRPRTIYHYDSDTGVESLMLSGERYDDINVVRTEAATEAGVFEEKPETMTSHGIKVDGAFGGIYEVIGALLHSIRQEDSSGARRFYYQMLAEDKLEEFATAFNIPIAAARMLKARVEPENQRVAEGVVQTVDILTNGLRKQLSDLIMGAGVNLEVVTHPNLPGAPTETRIIAPAPPMKIDLILDSDPRVITLNGFQEQILVTANTSMRWRDQVVNAVLGLGGETGEVIEEIVTAITALHGSTAKLQDYLKKYFFHNWSDSYHANPGAYEQIRQKIALELGDNLFYNAWLARLFGFSLGEVAQSVRRKLVQRHETPLSEGSPNDNPTESHV